MTTPRERTPDLVGALRRSIDAAIEERKATRAHFTRSDQPDFPRSTPLDIHVPVSSLSPGSCSCPRGDFHCGIDPDCVDHGQSPAVRMLRESAGELLRFWRDLA